MIKYATRLPPGKGVELLENGNIRKIFHFNMERTFVFMDALVKHFIRNPDPMVVNVFNYTVIDNYSYSYDMERLGLLSAEEREIVDIAGDWYDKHGSDAYEFLLNDVKIQFQGNEKLLNFLKLVIEQNRYHDLHSGNVMMDINGDYKLIDLEGFLKTPLSLKENDWITRDGT